MTLKVITGPNLNLLGSRENGVYGNVSLADIEKKLTVQAKELGFNIKCIQSNHEGVLVDEIQAAINEGVRGILINPGAYGHTSIALRDALLAVAIPFVEAHISNIYKREEFRHKTYLSDIADGIIIGLGPKSYQIGLAALAQVVRAKE